MVHDELLDSSNIQVSANDRIHGHESHTRVPQTSFPLKLFQLRSHRGIPISMRASLPIKLAHCGRNLVPQEIDPPGHLLRFIAALLETVKIASGLHLNSVSSTLVMYLTVGCCT
jgi:hypothetical protein